MTIASQATKPNRHFASLPVPAHFPASSQRSHARHSRHLQMQWDDCRQATEGLRDADTLKRLCLRLCEELRIKVAGSAFFQFSPGGVTGTLLLDDAHIALHTWPERGMLKADIDLRRQDGETAVLGFMDQLKTCFLPLTSAVEQRRRPQKIN